MNSWLWTQLRPIVGGGTVLTALAFVMKAFFGQYLQDVYQALKERASGRKTVVTFEEYYLEEMRLHSHGFVARMAGDAPAVGNAVEQLSAWIHGPQSSPFMILWGERGIGKSRCCIELAKKENAANWRYNIRRNRVRWINFKVYRSTQEEDFYKALDHLVRKGQVYIFDNYQDDEGYLDAIAKLAYNKGAKLLVVAFETEGPKAKLRKLSNPEGSSPGGMRRGELRKVVEKQGIQIGRRDQRIYD